MPVVYLLISDKMGEYTRFFSGCFRDHHEQGGVLDLIDPAGAGCSQHISASLYQAHIKILPAYIPDGQEGAGRQPGGFTQIGFLPEIYDLASAVGILTDILDQPVDQIVAPYCGAVALADCAVADIPRIPPGHTLFPHLGQDIGGIAIDCENLADARLPGLVAQGTDRKFPFAEVIPAGHMVYADRVSRSAVRVFGARIFIRIAIVQNIVYVVDQILIGFCKHTVLTCFLFTCAAHLRHF